MEIFKFTDINATIINMNHFVSLQYAHEYGQYLEVNIMCGNKTQTLLLKYNDLDYMYNDYKRFIKMNDLKVFE